MPWRLQVFPETLSPVSAGRERERRPHRQDAPGGCLVCAARQRLAGHSRRLDRLRTPFLPACRPQLAAPCSAESPLRDALHHVLIDSLEQAVFLKDAELRYLAANGPFCAALGFAEEV